MKSLWVKNLDNEEKERLVFSLKNNTLLINRFLGILQTMKEDLDRRELKEDHFNNPEWAAREAFLLGQKKKLNEIIDLFDLSKGD